MPQRRHLEAHRRRADFPRGDPQDPRRAGDGRPGRDGRLGGGEPGDAARLGTVGFCRGGRTVWLYAAHNPALKAAVAWYGPVGGPTSAIQPRTAADVAGGLRAPLLGLYGGKDGGIPVGDVEAAAAKARAAGHVVEIVIYPDAPHGFHADYRPSYRAEDAADGWQRMLAWFRRHGVG